VKEKELKMNQNPIYDIQESHLVTRTVLHPLLGKVAVIEDNSMGGVLMTCFVKLGDYTTESFDSVELATRRLNDLVINALQAMVIEEIEKVRVYQNELTEQI
jgi:hypothetical protein